MRRRRPATGGVLPSWRPTQFAGVRLFSALQTAVQPELPGLWLSLPVPVEGRRLADGRLRKFWIHAWKKSSFLPLCLNWERMNLLCHTWWSSESLLQSEELLSGGQRAEGRRGGELIKIRWSAFFFFLSTKPKPRSHHYEMDNWLSRFEL